jgi:hypothetical protein
MASSDEKGIGMAIKTKKYKSGQKKVNKKKATQLHGPLNRAARAINRAEIDDLSPGVQGLTDPIPRSLRLQKKKNETINTVRGRRQSAAR